MERFVACLNAVYNTGDKDCLKEIIISLIDALGNTAVSIFCDADDLVQGRERGDLTASYAAAAAVDAGALRRHF